MTFDGVALWGNQTKQHGPIGRARTLQQRAPGVNGFVLYNLGRDSYTFQVSGRLISDTAAGLEGQIKLGADYVANATVATFITNAGLSYPNSYIAAFEPVGRPQRCTTVVGGSPIVGWTVEVQGTVICQP